MYQSVMFLQSKSWIGKEYTSHHYTNIHKTLLIGKGGGGVGGVRKEDVKNKNSSNVLGHQFNFSNVKYKSDRMTGFAHLERVPTSRYPDTYLGVSVPVHKNFDYWISSQIISCDHSFESLCCTDFNYSIINIYTMKNVTAF